MEFEEERRLVFAEFRAESAEFLNDFESGVLALEAGQGETADLTGLLRIAHNLKGIASMLGLDAVTQLAHVMEDVLERIRGGELPLDGDATGPLLRGVDALRAQIALGFDAPDETADVRRLLEAVGRNDPAGPIAASSAAPVERAHQTDGKEDDRRLRVATSRLDRLLDLTSEIVIARGRLTELLEGAAKEGREDLLEAHRDADRLYTELQEHVTRLRLVPVSPVFRQQLRTARDAAAISNKNVQVELEGENVEVDNALIDPIREALTHIVRNAVAHGIESPEARKAAGKPDSGKLILRAFREAGSVVFQISDDGGGLSRRRIGARAEAMGLATNVDALDDRELFRFIFDPGFSTTEKANELSGRGVGLDVVRHNVEALRGSIQVESTAGRGTTFTLRLPLTLSIIDGFLVRAGDEVLVMPLQAVVECGDLPPGTPHTAREGVSQLRGRALPWVRVRTEFGLGGTAPRRESLVVVRHEGGVAGVVVDALLGERQVVIKPLGRLFRPVASISGSAVLGDGRVALLLEMDGLLAPVLRRARVAGADGAEATR